MAGDTHKAINDFSKLVCGSAEKKLFIGPIVSDGQYESFKNAFLPAARCAARTGEVFSAFVPRPETWETNTTSEVRLYRLADDGWVSV